MEEIEGHFDQFWGEFFESQFIDTDEFNYCCSLENGFDYEPSNSSSTEMEYSYNNNNNNYGNNSSSNIAEKRSAIFGFNSSPISSSFSPVESRYLTIPSGISPVTLLESPVLLPNSQHSPTTGTFPLATVYDDDNSFSPQTDGESDIDSYGMFMFKTPDSGGDFVTQNQTSKQVQAEAFKRDIASCSNMEMSTKNEIEDRRKSAISDLKTSLVDKVDHQESLHKEECVKVEAGINPLFESEEKAINPVSMKTSNGGDGYYWRKYGQKHVKGSEYPRSYYKCNNSNCLVKKKVERSHDGEITEIIYNGGHNHPKPHPRLSLGSPNSNSDWTCGSSDWTTADGLERMHLISQETPENHANAVANQNGDDQDRMIQWNTSPGEDVDGDESDPKRRKRDTFSSEAYLPSSRSIREPRIILQIESEIDVLEDGYRWRKYGQKVVKGNPNPRSYYKCTSSGCPVRKHVERASEDIKSVITTYEGKHDHEIPTIKKPGAQNAGYSPRNVSDSNNAPTMLKVEEFPMNYQLGVSSSIYQMKFPPPLQSLLPIAYSPFMMNINSNSNRNDVHTTSSFGTPYMHDLPMIGGASRNTNMAVSSFQSINYPRRGGVIQCSVGRMQQIKEEQKDDNSYNTIQYP